MWRGCGRGRACCCMQPACRAAHCPSPTAVGTQEGGSEVGGLLNATGLHACTSRQPLYLLSSALLRPAQGRGRGSSA